MVQPTPQTVIPQTVAKPIIVTQYRPITVNGPTPYFITPQQSGNMNPGGTHRKLGSNVSAVSSVSGLSTNDPNNMQLTQVSSVPSAPGLPEEEENGLELASAPGMASAPPMEAQMPGSTNGPPPPYQDFEADAPPPAYADVMGGGAPGEGEGHGQVTAQ